MELPSLLVLEVVRGVLHREGYIHEDELLPSVLAFYKKSLAFDKDYILLVGKIKGIELTRLQQDGEGGWFSVPLGIPELEALDLSEEENSLRSLSIPGDTKMASVVRTVRRTVPKRRR